MTTEFSIIYNCFYSKITDDMYMELDETQTKAMSEELLLNAIPWFEFPRVNINNYDLNKKCFKVELTYEEVNILATYMMLGWFDQQLASVEVARMKYSGSDFKFTSQANHMAKLNALRKEYERIGFHLQRLYKRRKTDVNGVQRSTFGSIMATSVRAGNVGSITNSNTNSGGALPKPPSGDDSGDDSWEDMEDVPTIPPSSDEGSWEEME
jgi:hypothetical protein